MHPRQRVLTRHARSLMASTLAQAVHDGAEAASDVAHKTLKAANDAMCVPRDLVVRIARARFSVHPIAPMRVPQEA